MPGTGPNFGRHPSKPAEFVYPGTFGEYLLLAVAPSPGAWLNFYFQGRPYKKCAGLIAILADYIQAIATAGG